MGNILDNFQKNKLEEAKKMVDEIIGIVRDNFAIGIESEISKELFNKSIDAFVKISTVLQISEETEKQMIEDLAEHNRG